MLIYVKTLLGKQISLNAEPEWEVGYVKQLLEEQVGIPVDRQRLLWINKDIENFRTLSDYNLSKESTLHLIEREETLSIAEVCEAILEAQNKDILASCAVVMRHLEKHKADEHVAKQGCFAIVKLILKNASLSTTIGTLDACRLLVELLGAHSTSAIVVSYVCWAIGSLTDDATNRAKLIDAGACEALVAALKRDTWCGDIALAVSWSFANLALQGSIARTKLGIAGACQIQVQAMRAHTNNSQVAHKGCWAAMNLSCTNNADNKMALLQAGIVDVMAAMLVNYELSEETRNKAKTGLVMMSAST